MKLSVEFPSVAYREGPEGVLRLARAIEQIGYDHVDVFDHVVMGFPLDGRPPGPYNPAMPILEALKIDPGYLPCIRALKGIYEIEKDFGSYEKSLVEEAKQTEDPTSKSRALLERSGFAADRAVERFRAAIVGEQRDRGGDLGGSRRPRWRSFGVVHRRLTFVLPGSRASRSGRSIHILHTRSSTENCRDCDAARCSAHGA